ncbi:hypothetical protein L1987_80416 [Smallanthus sonchifolius]|uniref:Uncharacterized protein n=1 Tax=Smallanthus sonchifolius TaxID=185202 RepID=A0ACB8YMI5_9ASTR|nr:hypothetical protein L1987_80416 [Smallanthus sonchifolius]
MSRIFRPSTFNKLTPLLQQRFAKANFNTSQPQHESTFVHNIKPSWFPPKISMELQQSIKNQTNVSTTLAAYLLSNKFPESNVVFSPLSIHAALSMVAAVYFKGAWRKTFDRSLTQESDFHLLHGNKVQVPFMTSKKDQFVREYDDFKVLGLPYLQGQDGRWFTMYIVLPDAKDGLMSLVDKIAAAAVSATVLAGSSGMTMTKKSINLVEVNEEGTEAAAVSTTIMAGSSGMTMTNKKVDFVADHPFLFAIIDDATGVVLSMGQVIDPTAG